MCPWIFCALGLRGGSRWSANGIRNATFATESDAPLECIVMLRISISSRTTYICQKASADSPRYHHCPAWHSIKTTVAVVSHHHYHHCDHYHGSRYSNAYSSCHYDSCCQQRCRCNISSFFIISIIVVVLVIVLHASSIIIFSSCPPLLPPPPPPPSALLLGPRRSLHEH